MLKKCSVSVVCRMLSRQQDTRNFIFFFNLSGNCGNGEQHGPGPEWDGGEQRHLPPHTLTIHRQHGWSLQLERTAAGQSGQNLLNGVLRGS